MPAATGAGVGLLRRTALRGLGQQRRAAERPGRTGQDVVDGHARQRPAVAQAEVVRAGLPGLVPADVVLTKDSDWIGRR